MRIENMSDVFLENLMVIKAELPPYSLGRNIAIYMVHEGSTVI